MSDMSGFVLTRFGVESPSIPLAMKKNIVGRCPTADIAIKSPYCSRYQCSLTATAECVYLEDTSRFGTYVNTDRVHQAMRTLTVNDCIGFGCVTTLGSSEFQKYSNDIFVYKLEKHAADEIDGNKPNGENMANITIHLEEMEETDFVEPMAVDHPDVPKISRSASANEVLSDDKIEALPIVCLTQYKETQSKSEDVTPLKNRSAHVDEAQTNTADEAPEINRPAHDDKMQIASETEERQRNRSARADVVQHDSDDQIQAPTVRTSSPGDKSQPSSDSSSSDMPLIEFKRALRARKGSPLSSVNRKRSARADVVQHDSNDKIPAPTVQTSAPGDKSHPNSDSSSSDLPLYEVKRTLRARKGISISPLSSENRTELLNTENKKKVAQRKVPAPNSKRKTPPKTRAATAKRF